MTELELYRAQTRCISHEIRNHLSICELYSQIIRKNYENQGMPDKSTENALNCIQKSLKIIANSLIDLKSLNNFSPARYNLNNLLKTGVDMSMIYIGEKEVKINCDLCADVNVEVDENKFLACIVNIIKNAVEAIDDKGEIDIKCTVQDSMAHILISNNGMPISEEQQQQIFEEGFSTKAAGSGLGLHICKTNLALQNAELKLNKSDSVSTEFEIVLPAQVTKLVSK